MHLRTLKCPVKRMAHPRLGLRHAAEYLMRVHPSDGTQHCSRLKPCLVGFPASGIILILCMGEQVLEVVPKDAARLHPQVDRPCTASSIWHRVQHNCAVILLQATLNPQVPFSVFTTGTACSDT